MAKKENDIAGHLAEKIGFPGLTDVLSNEAWRNVQPILIEALRARARKKKPIDLLAEYESKLPFFGVSAGSESRSLQIQTEFYSVAREIFQIVNLAPIAPLGLNSVLSSVSQDTTLSTIRSSEVVSDPTTTLALECARQRKVLLTDPMTIGDPINLATLSSVLRLQPFDSSKGYLQHFRILGLCSGGRNSREHQFNHISILEHIATWLQLIARLQSAKWEFRNLRVSISNMQILETLICVLSLPREEIIRHSLDEDFDLFDAYNLDLPKMVDSAMDLPNELIERLKIHNPLRSLETLESLAGDLVGSNFPEFTFSIELDRKSGLGYYSGVCYHIYADLADGRTVQLADGGEVGWLSRLLNSKKEQMFTSGFGCELVNNLFSPS